MTYKTKLFVLKNMPVAQHKDVGGYHRIGKETTTSEKTIEEAVNDIAGEATIRSVILVLLAMSYGLSVDSLAYITVFTGL